MKITHFLTNRFLGIFYGLIFRLILIQSKQFIIFMLVKIIFFLILFGLSQSFEIDMLFVENLLVRKKVGNITGLTKFLPTNIIVFSFILKLF
jgi:hypothetical protein